MVRNIGRGDQDESGERTKKGKDKKNLREKEVPSFPFTGE